MGSFAIVYLGKGDRMSVQQFPEEVEAKDRAFYRRRTFVLWPWFFVVAAWAVLVFATLTHQTYLLNHQYLLQGSGLPWLAALEVFLLCWQVMIVAMMLPSSMPMLTLVVYAGRRYHRPVAIPLAFLAGYGAIWTAFAAAAFILDTLVHRIVTLWPWLAVHPWLIGAVMFVIAGLFQFTPLKARCLTASRTPRRFLLHHYCRGVESAWELGLRHGVVCLGCCWALMLVMFGVGVGSLAAMAALTSVMVIEKAVPGGNRLSPLVGLALFLLAGLWLAHPLWLRIAIL